MDIISKETSSSYINERFYVDTDLKRYKRITQIIPEFFSEEFITRDHLSFIFKASRIDIFKHLVKNGSTNIFLNNDQLFPYECIIKMKKQKIRELCEFLYQEKLMFISPLLTTYLLFVNIASNNVFIVEYIMMKVGELWEPPQWIYEGQLDKTEKLIETNNVTFFPDSPEYVPDIIDLTHGLSTTNHKSDELLIPEFESNSTEESCDIISLDEELLIPEHFAKVHIHTIELMQRYGFNQEIIDFCIINSINQYSITEISELLSHDLTRFIINHADSSNISSENMCQLIKLADAKQLKAVYPKTIMQFLNRGTDVTEALIHRGVNVIGAVEIFVHPQIASFYDKLDTDFIKQFTDKLPMKIRRLSCVLRDACRIDSQEILDIIFSIHFHLKWKLSSWEDLICFEDVAITVEKEYVDENESMFSQRFYQEISMDKFHKIFNNKANHFNYRMLEKEIPTILSAKRTDILTHIMENYSEYGSTNPRLSSKLELSHVRFHHLKHLEKQQLVDIIECFILRNFSFEPKNEINLHMLRACMETGSVLLVDTILTKMDTINNQYSGKLIKYFKKSSVKCNYAIVMILINHKCPWSLLSFLIISNNSQFTTQQLLNIIEIVPSKHMHLFISGHFRENYEENMEEISNEWYKERHVEIVQYLIKKGQIYGKVVEKKIGIILFIMWKISDIEEMFPILMKEVRCIFSCDEEANVRETTLLEYLSKKISCPKILNELLTTQDSSSRSIRIQTIEKMGIKLDFSGFTVSDLRSHFENSRTDILEYLIERGVDVLDVMRSLIDPLNSKIGAWEREHIGDVIIFERNVPRVDLMLIELGMSPEEAINIYYNF